VPLDYTVSNDKSDVAFPKSLTVGVFQFEDLRGWSPRVAAREIRLVTAEIPVANDADATSEKEVSVFVTEAISKELEVRRLSVSTGGDYAQVVTFEDFQDKLKNMPLSTDRVIFGRIKYLNWLGPGFAGLLFQGMMPNGKAYVDLDVVVVDPRTSVVKWAGQARSKIDSGTSWGATPEEKGQQLTTALRTALEKCFSRADFTQAFDTTAK